VVVKYRRSVAELTKRNSVGRFWVLGAAALTCVLGCSAADTRAQDADLIALLGSGSHVGLMRHATAPGSDDPPGFRLGDCPTQRNLSVAGRAQAAAIGQRLRANGIAAARVLSSQWCRCLDTATLLGLGQVEELPSLNSLVSNAGEAAEMTGATREWLLEQDLSRPTILVTHQVNIGALVRSYPNEGEIVVVRIAPDIGLDVVGTIGVD
jgi:phosphohistidine phosphatase SixA